MDQTARVTAVKNGWANLELERHEACKKCGVCHMGSSKTLELWVANTIEARPGQRGVLRMSGRSVIQAGLIVYLLPTMLLLTGLAAGYAVAGQLDWPGRPELWGTGLGVASFVWAFVAIRRLEPRWRKDDRFSPRLVRLAREAEHLDQPCGDDDEQG